MISQRELDEFLGNFKARKSVVKKVKYPELCADSLMPQARLPIEFLNDVKVDIWAELGETTLTVKEILNLKQETVIELDKAAGDNLTLRVNGRDFARGEVIIIGTNLGIRVDRICDPGLDIAGAEKTDG